MPTKSPPDLAIGPAGATSRTRSPWFLITPPQHQGGVVDRRRLIEKIDASVAAHRVTTVTAPAGFGKTVALSEWSRRAAAPVAWLSLTRFDKEPARVVHGVVSALRRMAKQTGDARYRPLLALSPDLQDLAADSEAVAFAIDAVGLPVMLVIDDAHVAVGEVPPEVFGGLLEAAPPALRIILAGRESLDAPLSRLLVSGTAHGIRAAELAFTDEEVVAAGTALGRPVTGEAAIAIRRATGGWPAAVRLALVSADGRADRAAEDQPGALAPRGDEPNALLTEFVADEILAQLHPELAEFVLSATTCSRLDAHLAAALSGRTDAAVLLEECVARGLFLDRFAQADGQIAYRWHTVFATQCRAILGRRDPARRDRLNRLAAEALAGVFPLEAIVHAQRSGDPAFAVRTITSHWLGLVIEANADALDRLCSALPAPWASDPQVLMIRAACRDVAGDRARGALLFERATSALGEGDRPADDELAFTQALAELFLADDSPSLTAAADHVRESMHRLGALDPAIYPCTLFVLGWTELRLRRDPAGAVALLQSAAREAELAGQHLVAYRANANLGFALAYGGRLTAARAMRGQEPDPDDPSPEWHAYDGGIELMTTGFVAYWQNDLDAAELALQRVLEGGETAYTALARVYVGFVAAAQGDGRGLATAEAEVRKISDVEVHGVPWRAWKLVAYAKLAEARGRMDLALSIAHRAAALSSGSVSAVLLAEVFRRGGDARAAAAVLAQIEPAEQISYVRASGLVTQALLERARGRTAKAHQLMEASLDAAAAESVARPFSDQDPDLCELLVEHATWGTQHGEFLAARIAHTGRAAPRLAVGAPLSPREREILGLLRTAMTTAEIAASLYVSVNTVKTHQRAIYRKLGVKNRREAVKARL